MAADARRIKELFVAALEQAGGAARQAFLDRTCAGQPELRHRLDILLQAHDAPASALNRPLAEIVPENPGPAPTVEMPAPREGFGAALAGRYRLVEEIGEGGMGTVWMAQQTEPIKRLVAVKLIKTGMDSKAVLARFEAERQALALMDHPHIARVLDAGSTDKGRPYFVMDLVKGVPITRYCDDYRLTPRQRVELFVPVCQAVQHAHQKGIIHRDLKPSNVLVAHSDGRPVPKVIDFGVAKATGQSLTEKTLVTGLGAIVGTLEYMSPEQAEINQLDIDTRSDIYSLGVLLYELLTGSPPFTRKELENAGMLEMLRVIREQEPPKPSTKLSTAEELPALAANRGTEPAKLTRLVRGELDWIVMKALEKDRARRYETANGFAMDLQRYLADEPVQACPPSAGYRFRKFVRRNKRALVTTGLLVIMLLAAVGGVASTIGWAVRERTAREEELARDRKARQDKLNHEVELALREASASRDRALTLTDNPYQWEATLAAALSAFKRAEGLASQEDAPLEPAVGERLQNLRTILDADQNDRRFVARFDDIRLEQTRLDTRDSRYMKEIAFAWLKDAFHAHYGIDFGVVPATQVVSIIQQRPKAIQEYLVAALDESLTQAPQQEPQARKWLATVLETADSDPWRKRARSAAAAHDWQAVEKLLHEATPSRQSRDFLLRLACALPREATPLRLLRQIQLAHPDDFWANNSLAGMLQYRARPQLDEAIRYYTAAIALRPRSPGVYVDMGNALRSKGDLDGAITAFREATRCGGDYTGAYIRLEETLRQQGSPDEVIAEFKAVAQAQPEDAWAHRALGFALMAKSLFDEAIPAFKRAIRLQPAYASTHFGLGCALQRKGLLDDAIREHREALRLNAMNADHHRDLGIALTEKRLLDDALAELREALRLDPGNADTRSWLGIALGRKGLWDEAITEFSKSLEQFPKDARYWNYRGGSYAELGRWKEAIADFAKANELKRDDPLPRYRQALVCLQLGQVMGYRKLCADMLEQFAPASNADSAHWTVWTCVLTADAVADWKVSLRLAGKAVADNPKDYRALNHHGAVLYRASQYQEALKRLTEAEAVHLLEDKKRHASASNWLFLAMAHHRLGHAEEAKKWHDKAVQRIDQETQKKPDEPTVAHPLPWNQRLTLQLLRREAEELLKQK
jgi:serine/threonine protein kinase/tetratricopeptide (TPR) repeat protein